MYWGNPSKTLHTHMHSLRKSLIPYFMSKYGMSKCWNIFLSYCSETYFSHTAVNQFQDCILMWSFTTTIVTSSRHGRSEVKQCNSQSQISVTNDWGYIWKKLKPFNKERSKGGERKKERGRESSLCEFDVPHHYIVPNDFFHLLTIFDKILTYVRMQD